MKGYTEQRPELSSELALKHCCLKEEEDAWQTKMSNSETLNHSRHLLASH